MFLHQHSHLHEQVTPEVGLQEEFGRDYLKTEGERDRGGEPMLGSWPVRILDTVEAIDGDEVADPAMIEGKKHPLPEHFEVKIHMVRASCIEAWTL